ncbi:hypothetical protein CCS01_26030 [Rhodopila globiformis]|uniref:Uncharacterized protein n=1 Tax=Rhodopila globiformis TaxID=1071 RepID=A0A2S6MZS8_RHOGL|nr:hypothetical protein CCS01_26030 [Rhodopila globiformis]
MVHTSPARRSSDFVAHPEQIDALHGPMPGRAGKPVVLAGNNGPLHVRTLPQAALADADGAIDKAAGHLNQERAGIPLAKSRISA